MSQDVTVGRNWIKGTRDLSVLYLMLHFKEALQVLPLREDHGPHLLQIVISAALVRVGHSWRKSRVLREGRMGKGGKEWKKRK